MEEDRPKTAYSAHQGQFHWRVKPFGLTNGPANFTRLMNLVLSGLTCMDTLSGVFEWYHHLRFHLSISHPPPSVIFWSCKDYWFELKPTKCHFLWAEVAFFRRVVSSYGMKIETEKVKAVKTWSVPLNVKGRPYFWSSSLDLPLLRSPSTKSGGIKYHFDGN